MKQLTHLKNAYWSRQAVGLWVMPWSIRVYIADRLNHLWYRAECNSTSRLGILWVSQHLASFLSALDFIHFPLSFWGFLSISLISSIANFNPFILQIFHLVGFLGWLFFGGFYEMQWKVLQDRSTKFPSPTEDTIIIQGGLTLLFQSHGL